MTEDAPLLLRAQNQLKIQRRRTRSPARPLPFLFSLSVLRTTERPFLPVIAWTYHYSLLCDDVCHGGSRLSNYLPLLCHQALELVVVLSSDGSCFMNFGAEFTVEFLEVLHAQVNHGTGGNFIVVAIRVDDPHFYRRAL